MRAFPRAQESQGNASKSFFGSKEPKRLKKAFLNMSTVVAIPFRSMVVKMKEVSFEA